MTIGMLREGPRMRAIAVLTILLLSAIPLMPSAIAVDSGDPQLLQAQGINAVYDSISETTTITWSNIADDGGIVNLHSELWASYYNIYRHTDVITTTNINSLIPFSEPILACDQSVLGGNPNLCRGDTHAGHEVIYEVPPGINGTYYYAITTTLDDGSTSMLLDDGASNFSTGVEELTSPIRSPYNIEASYDPSTGMTTIDWINYNDINPILPIEGNDSYSTNLWRTVVPVTRTNAGTTLVQANLIENLAAGVSSHSYLIDSDTNRNSYYSVTYNLPNYTTPGQVYQDLRMLSSNAMIDPVLEDNIPPGAVTGTTAEFVENSGQGTGTTTISWNDLGGETGERYRIYYSATEFNQTTQSDVYLLSEVSENVESYAYALPIGTLGYTHYCVVVIDQYGAFDENISASSCSGAVLEDAFNNWIAEPTNVDAQYIGNATTRVTWTDQVGAEGETYYVWEGSWMVSGLNWESDPSILTQVCEVPDGVQMCDVNVEWTSEGTIPEEITSFYFVTSLARYGQISGNYHYMGLDQNGVGPVYQDIKPPTRAVMSEVVTSGTLQRLDIKWQISAEDDETYTVYRHLGEPFADGDSQVYDINDEGWEMVAGGIKDPAVGQYVTHSVNIEDNVDRDLWYAVLITDAVGNTDTEIFGGPGGNAILVSEDTKVAEATLALKLKDSNSEVLPGSLTAGSYTVFLESDEELAVDPTINVSSSSGNSLSNGVQGMFPQGGKYYFPIDVSSSTAAGDLLFQVTLVDISGNEVTLNLSDYSLDARSPEITIYSPSPSSDGSKYLYGNNIVVIAGITDDVELESLQIKYVRNYGATGAVNEPWRNVTGLNVLNDDNNEWSFQMEFAAGNFEYGTHQVIIRAIDSAGNQKDADAIFVVDWCRHREDGATICENENPVAEDPVAVYIDPGFGDAPYTIVWIIAAVSVFSLIAAAMILMTSLSAPKKKRGGDDDDEDEDWMSEFIGTSAEPNMDDIATGGQAGNEKAMVAAPEEEEEEEDPFDTVNKLERKTRPKKKKVVEIPEEEDIDDFGFDDEEDENFEWGDDESPMKKPSKRKITRKPAARKVGRKPVRRNKD